MSQVPLYSNLRGRAPPLQGVHPIPDTLYIYILCIPHVTPKTEPCIHGMRTLYIGHGDHLRAVPPSLHGRGRRRPRHLRLLCARALLRP